MNTEIREKKIQNVTLWGALVNLILTGLKLLAGLFGHSAAMVADGLHSLSDLLSDAVVLIFTHISSKGKDRDHAFGHGKFETFATLIVSVMLVIVGAGLMKQGVTSIICILRGETIPSPGYIAKVILFRVTSKVGRTLNSPIVIANAWHHRSDAMSSIGSLVGIGGALLLGNKWTILDPLASCFISIAIIVVATKMGLPSISELLEASLPKDIEDDIRSIASAIPGVRNIHELKTRRNGMSYIIDAHILVDPTISVVASHDIATMVENALTQKFGMETQINIHVEPDTK